jgi:uncharacterized protein
VDSFVESKNVSNAMTTPTHGPVIDACVHHRWKSPTEADILDYLPAGWRDYVGKPGSVRGSGGARPTIPHPMWRNPMGEDVATATRVDGEPAGSDVAALVQDVLVQDNVERALLIHDRAMFAPGGANVYLVGPFCRAVNDWSIEQWLERDDRLYGAVVANTQLPEEGAAEIRRIGSHPKMAAVILVASPSGKFFGHPSYFPILEAAQELDLPVIIHRGGDAVSETPTRPAGGNPFTFAEYMVISPLFVINQLTSLIANGCFERYPRLRILLAGVGFGWIPSCLRRADISWRSFRAEVPWVRKAPHEYFQQHVRVSTYGLETGAGDPFVRSLLSNHPELKETLVYGSGYPSWDTSRASETEDLLPADWLPAVLHDNADAWFRWDHN